MIDNTTTLIEKFESAGLSADAASWLAEWYPEAESYVDAGYGSVYSPYCFCVMSEDEFVEYLDWHETDEDGYNERYGITLRDVAFDGVIVIGE